MKGFIVSIIFLLVSALLFTVFSTHAYAQLGNCGQGGGYCTLQPGCQNGYSFWNYPGASDCSSYNETCCIPTTQCTANFPLSGWCGFAPMLSCAQVGQYSQPYSCGSDPNAWCCAPTKPDCTNNWQCGACNSGGLPTNHCGWVGGSQSCSYTGTQPCNTNYNNYACSNFINNCQNPFSCINQNTCEKTMGGRVTINHPGFSDNGNGIGGVVIAGGGTTNGNGDWSRGGMAYGAGFSFTAPSGAGSNPCNNGFECGSNSPNPGKRSGTVGGGGDCGMNCDFTYTPGSISGNVYVNPNHNGTGETPANGVLVQDTAGDYTYTDATGYYLLDYLNTQTYTVYVHNFPGYKVTTAPYTLVVPPNRTNINFLIDPAYSVSGYVFWDYNYNNNFDAEDSSYIPPPAVNVVNTAATLPVISDANLTLQNASFETGGTPPSGWNFYVTAPAAGNAVQDCGTSENGGCSAHIHVSTADPGNFWYLNLLQPNVSLTQDTAYEVTFYAKAQNNAHPIWVFLQQIAAPWVGYGWYNPTIPSDNTWRKYSFVFTSDYTDATSNLEFEFAQVTGDVWIDNVSIRPMSYTIPKLYNGNYNQTLAPLPPNTAQSPPVPNPVTVNGADVIYENLGISPLYFVSGNVYQDLNKDACWEPAYDPLYTKGGNITFHNAQFGDTLVYPLNSDGTYDTLKTLHAGIWNVSYAIPPTYQALWPPGGQTIVTVGTPGKSIACDTTLAQNPVCW